MHFMQSHKPFYQQQEKPIVLMQLIEGGTAIFKPRAHP